MVRKKTKIEALTRMELHGTSLVIVIIKYLLCSVKIGALKLLQSPLVIIHSRQRRILQTLCHLNNPQGEDVLMWSALKKMVISGIGMSYAHLDHRAKLYLPGWWVLLLFPSAMHFLPPDGITGNHVHSILT